MQILVTGAAGFIGFHTCKILLEQGVDVIGVDNLNDYYDPQLKKDRLDIIQQYSNFSFHKLDLADKAALEQLFSDNQISHVINLAAQAGVQYSLVNPQAYVDSNLVGFVNLLECCRSNKIRHLIFASSSSVYGSNTKMPFSEDDSVDHPISMYAATKKANELLAHSYAHLYGLPTTGLRFFTVYGPWGRPDMAYYKFAKEISEQRPIDVYYFGKAKRDFTYIDDIVTSLVKLIDLPATADASFNSDTPNPSSSHAPYRIYNIGNNKPVDLLYFIQVIEQSLQMKAKLNLLPARAGDVPATYADIDKLHDAIGFAPTTNIELGIERFATWFSDYHSLVIQRT